MRVTFIDKIEYHKAFFNRMRCSKCGSPLYSVHHQIKPEEIFGWWVQCDKCGHEGYHASIKEIAVDRWEKEWKNW